MRRVTFAMLLTISAYTQSNAQTSFAVDTGQSIFAVITHKGGIAAAFAHDHFVYPGTYKAELTYSSDAVEETQFQLTFQTTDLVLAPSDVESKWFPDLERTGILKDPFKTISEDDRKTIAEHMVGEGQLDAEQFPEFKARLVRLTKQESTRGEATFTWQATLEITIHGKTIEKDFPATIEETGQSLHIEALTTCNFSDFGIKPFSAALGAVKNKDQFHIYVNLTANPQTAP